MIEIVKQTLANASLTITDERRLPNSAGTQLRLKGGGIVNVFDTGKIQVQGRNTSCAKVALADLINGSVTPTPEAPCNEVFVVYGHDQTACTQLEAMLRRWKLEPLFLNQLPSEGQTLIEKLEMYTARVNFAVVLATPDDEGYRTEHPDERAFRARQNVVLELGMLLALLGRNKVAILLKAQEKMERPSDIQGLIYIPFNDNLEKEAGLVLAKEMAAQGYKIDVTKI